MNLSCKKLNDNWACSMDHIMLCYIYLSADWQQFWINREKSIWETLNKFCWIPHSYPRFFFYQGFLSDTNDSQDRRGREGTSFSPLYHFRHLLATLHVRLLSRFFNRNACVYYSMRFTTSLNYYLIDFVTAIWRGKPVNLNSHRLSLLYYKPTD